MEKKLGPNDKALSSILGQLAECYTKQGKLAEAEPLLERAKTIQSKATQ